MDRIVGYGFRPTDEELVNHYLKYKILGYTWLVEDAINDVDFYSFDPWDLRFQSRIDSNDYVWYFFCRVENKKMQSRKTSSGFWKKTGPTLDIKTRRGNRAKIGEKKVLVFHTGRTPNGVGTEWVMHEYHTTFFPPDQVNQPLQGDSGCFSWQVGLSPQELQSLNEFGDNLNTPQQQAPWLDDDDEMQRFLDSLTAKDWDFMLGDQEIASHNVMQENCNDYRPHKSLTGLYVDDCTESDAESTSSTSHNETSSPVDSVGASNGNCQNHMNDILTSGTNYRKEQPATALQSRSRPKHITDDEAKGHPKEKVTKVTESLRRDVEPTKKENCHMEMMEREWKMAQDTIKKACKEKKGWFIFEDVLNTSRQNRLINIIIAFILLFLPLIPGFISLR